MVELVMVPLVDLEDHPANPRHDVGNVDELAASIAQIGVLEPVIVSPAGISFGLCAACGYVHQLDEDGDLVRHTKGGRSKMDCPGTGAAPKVRRDRWRLLAGHRRVKAARQAGLEQVPALPRPDIDGDAAQLAAMLAENLQRVNLTPVEEAEGYQQLRLFGWKNDAIATATGRTKSTVSSRLKLAKLPAATRDRLHARELTLDVAEKLVEFADDPQLVARLEREAGGYNWSYALQRARQDRAHAKARAATAKKLAADGVAIIDKPAGYPYESVEQPVVDVVGPIDQDTDADWREVQDKAIAEHASCPHHAAYIDPYTAQPIYVCAQPETHADWEERKARVLHDPDEVERRAGREARKAALTAAMVVRLDFVRDVIADRVPVADGTLTPVLRAAVRARVAGLYTPEVYAAVLDLLGADVPTAKSRTKAAALAYVDAVPTVYGLIKVLLAVAAAAVENDRYGGLAYPDSDYLRHDGTAAAWIGQLEALGYQPSDVDRELATKPAEEPAQEPEPAGVVVPDSSEDPDNLNGPLRADPDDADDDADEDV